MSKSVKSVWKVWLRLNLLTKEVDNDYNAEVSTLGNTLRNEDIARQIIDEGSEIKYDTILNIINRSDGIVRNSIKEGKSVQTGYCHISPRVSGPWIGANAGFDPAIHKITVDMSPSPELRQTLDGVTVEVLGVKDSGAYIGTVTDTATGLTDGSITSGDDILIEGEKIRVAPDGEDGLGVFFVDAGGYAHQVTRRLTQNDPKKIIARVPALPAGEYTLRIVTRYSNSTQLLKEPRTVDYPKNLNPV